MARSDGHLIPVILVLAACASSSVQKIGTSAYAPLAEDIIVFTEANQIKSPYEVIGIISYNNPGKYQVLTLGDAIEPLKEKAREIGTNTIIIDKSQPAKSANGNIHVVAGDHLLGVPRNRLKLDGFYVINIRCSYRIIDNVELFAIVENLFDNKYATLGIYGDVTATPLPGVAKATDPRFVSGAAPRSVFGGVRMRF